MVGSTVFGTYQMAQQRAYRREAKMHANHTRRAQRLYSQAVALLRRLELVEHMRHVAQMGAIYGRP